ncbi:ATP-binding protein [Desulfovibrio sp. Fe33]|uniref:ATP-binding protein n=1 Tax=Desulfovibrio sp. Fe33 TaxID=3020842 RepID=UPI00234CDFF2|nr:ATP-binding protein [Desulfovibrio sp. Fe33]
MTAPTPLLSILELQEPDAALACRAGGAEPANAQIIEVNRTACAMLGLTRQEILGSTPGKIITNFSALTKDDSRFETGSRRIEHTLRSDIGNTPVEIRSHALVFDGVPLFIVMIRDITLRRQREGLADLNEQRFRALYTISRMINRTEEEILDYALTQSVHLTDSRMGYIGFMDEYETFITLRPWSISGPDECTIPDKSRTFPVEKGGLWAEAVRRRTPVIINDYANAPERRGVPEGHVSLFRHMNVPVIDRNRIQILVGVANKDSDYTDSDSVQLSLIMDGVWQIIQRKRMEKELVRAMHEARFADRAKTQFLANMSHELRTPLNGIMGMTQLLLNTDGLTDEQKEYLNLSLESGIQLSRVLSSLLDLSSIETAEENLNRTDFDLHETIRSATDLLRPQAELKEIGLECSLDRHLPAMVHGDGEKLRQILINLVHNAVKFTEEGHVTVSACSEASRDIPDLLKVRISVADTGVGIPEDKREDIFERFMLGEDLMTKRYSGAGLGLTISRRLAEIMGGTISLESRPGEGSVFTLSLPFFVVSNKAYANYSSKENSLRLNILVADGDEISALATTRLLKDQGHNVLVVTNGQHAIDALMQGGFDLVLMAVQMPIINGIEVTEIIRSGAAEGIDADIPIVGLTVFSGEAERKRFQEKGMNEVVTMPFKDNNLLEAILNAAIRHRPTCPFPAQRP